MEVFSSYARTSLTTNDMSIISNLLLFDSHIILDRLHIPTLRITSTPLLISVCEITKLFIPYDAFKDLHIYFGGFQNWPIENCRFDLPS